MSKHTPTPLTDEHERSMSRLCATLEGRLRNTLIHARRLERDRAGLLAALEALLCISEAWYAEYCRTNNLTFIEHNAGQTPCVRQARAAIAKATEGKEGS